MSTHDEVLIEAAMLALWEAVAVPHEGDGEQDRYSRRVATAIVEAVEPLVRADVTWEYEIVYDGDPKMDGGHERRVTGRLKSLEEARRGYDIVHIRAPHSGDKPNLRIERRRVTPWEVVVR